jgi:hypothetical protein
MLLGGTKLGMHPIQTNPQYFIDHHRQIAHATKHLYNAEHASKPMLARERAMFSVGKMSCRVPDICAVDLLGILSTCCGFEFPSEQWNRAGVFWRKGAPMQGVPVGEVLR